MLSEKKISFTVETLLRGKSYRANPNVEQKTCENCLTGLYPQVVLLVGSGMNMLRYSPIGGGILHKLSPS
jgi:hypothetical protein